MTQSETFDALRSRLNARYEDLSPHLQRIALYSLEDPKRFALDTIASIATKTQVQPSTVIRFAKEFDYDGFSQMQRVFKLRLIEGVPDYRERVYEREHTGVAILEEDPKEVLSEFVDASIDALKSLRNDIDGAALKTAVNILASADHVFIAGQRRAFPIAAYVTYSLTRLERRNTFLDFAGGMASQQAATLTSRDVLVAISFAEYFKPVVDIVRDVHIRGVPVVAITDTTDSPLSKNSAIAFHVEDNNAHRFRPIAGAIGLVQTLMILVGAFRD